MLKKEIFVLDSTVFCEPAGLPKGELLTTPGVVEELQSAESRLKFELAGVRVVEPTKEAAVVAAAKETNDRLTETDVGVVALALEKGATVVSDDYGVQNLATKLGLKILALTKAGIKEVWTYGFRCRGCGREGTVAGSCAVCGGEIRRFRRHKG